MEKSRRRQGRVVDPEQENSQGFLTVFLMERNSGDSRLLKSDEARLVLWLALSFHRLGSGHRIGVIVTLGYMKPCWKQDGWGGAMGRKKGRKGGEREQGTKNQLLKCEVSSLVRLCLSRHIWGNWMACVELLLSSTMVHCVYRETCSFSLLRKKQLVCRGA